MFRLPAKLTMKIVRFHIIVYGAPLPLKEFLDPLLLFCCRQQKM